MKGPSAAVFPAAVVILFFLTIVCVYVLSVTENHVYPIWPYVSDCLMLFPETSISRQSIDIAATLMFWSHFLRLKQLLSMVRELDRSSRASVSIHIRRFVLFLSYFAFISSLVSIFGLVMIGAYPESSGPSGNVHFVAASLTVAGACCHMNADAVASLTLSHRIRRSPVGDSTNRVILVIRLVAAPLATVFAITTNVALDISQYFWLEAFPNQSPEDLVQEQLHWNRTFPGYPVRVTSTVCEWLMVLLFVTYIGTFAVEFRKISVRISIAPAPGPRYRRLKSADSTSSQCSTLESETRDIASIK